MNSYIPIILIASSLGLILGLIFRKPVKEDTKSLKYYFGHYTGLQYIILPRPWNSTDMLIDFHGEELLSGKYQWPVIFQAQFHDIKKVLKPSMQIEEQILDELEVKDALFD